MSLIKIAIVVIISDGEENGSPGDTVDENQDGFEDEEDSAELAPGGGQVSFVELLERGPTPPPEINMTLPANHLDFSTILPSLAELEGEKKLEGEATENLNFPPQNCPCVTAFDVAAWTSAGTCSA